MPTTQINLFLVEVGLRAQNAIEISERHVTTITFTINFCLATFLSWPCGHKHVYNIKKFLLPSFDSPVATSTFTIIFLNSYKKPPTAG
jgi:hypothetical protein